MEDCRGRLVRRIDGGHGFSKNTGAAWQLGQPIGE